MDTSNYLGALGVTAIIGAALFMMPYGSSILANAIRLPSLAVLALLVGCATISVTTPDGKRVVRTKDEFADYVETVFRLQNRVTDDVITFYALSEDPDPLPDPSVVSAEQRMVQSCQYVNDLVVAFIEGRKVGFLKQMALIKTVAQCEYAARALDTVMTQLEQTPVANAPKP